MAYCHIKSNSVKLKHNASLVWRNYSTILMYVQHLVCLSTIKEAHIVPEMSKMIVSFVVFLMADQNTLNDAT